MDFQSWLKTAPQRAKVFFQRFSKPRKDARKLPAAKRRNSKGARFFVYALMILLFLGVPLSFIRSGNALLGLEDTQQTVASIQEETENASTEDYSTEEIEVFGDRFVENYITISQDSDERQANQEELSAYLADGVEAPSVQGVEGYRTLDNRRLYDIEPQENHILLKYRVDYTNVAVEEIEEDPDDASSEEEDSSSDEDSKEEASEDEDATEEEDDGGSSEPTTKETETSKTAILNIPVLAHENQYIVIDSPYYTDMPDLVGSGTKAEPDMNGREEIGVDEQESIRSFLQEFYTKYANDDASELNYMMDEPEALGGIRAFESIDDLTVYAGEDENTYTALASVTFKESEIGVRNTEHYRLELDQRDGRYYVTAFNHTQGE